SLPGSRALRRHETAGAAARSGRSRPGGRRLRAVGPLRAIAGGRRPRLNRDRYGRAHDNMRARPLSVTLPGWLFMAAGAVGLAYHAGDVTAGTPIRFEVVWVLLLRLLAVLIGIWLLRGARTARWLAVLWLTYHVGLSVFHDAGELIAH